jgi:AraC-like DNA-binding protein
MNNRYDLILDNTSLAAQVIFVGTRNCGRENLLNTYTTGSLHFIRSGRASVQLAGHEPVLVERPSLVFFPRASVHGLQALDAEGMDLICAITSFNEGLRQSLALSFPEMVVMPLDSAAPMRHAAEAFFAEAASCEPGSRQLADKLCTVVLAYLVRHVCEAEAPQAGLLAAAGDRGIASAVRAIHTSFEAGLDLETLARGAGMSRSRFVERFKRLVGTSPHNYLVNYRIGIAQQLLARRLPVKTVAQRVGYETTAAFVRKFKEVVGVSPGAWAK